MGRRTKIHPAMPGWLKGKIIRRRKRNKRRKLMGYMHIDNLYKNQDILLFRECYALEKIHGTSCSIRFDLEEEKVTVKYFSGGVKHESFVALFDEAPLVEVFKKLGAKTVVIFGEGYGGKMQRMSDTYGKDLKFVVFDVKLGDYWLDVPDMAEVAKSFGLDVVDFVKCSTDIEELDKQRDRFSVQAEKNGCGSDKLREGIVLRPLKEFKTKQGNRIISKHKGDAFSERVKQPKVAKLSKEKLEVLTEARVIAQEWVTPMRLTHVLDKLPQDTGIESMRTVICAMQEDVEREGEGEIEWSRDAKKEVGKRTAQLFKQRLNDSLHNK